MLQLTRSPHQHKVRLQSDRNWTDLLNEDTARLVDPFPICTACVISSLTQRIGLSQLVGSAGEIVCEECTAQPGSPSTPGGAPLVAMATFLPLQPTVCTDS